MQLKSNTFPLLNLFLQTEFLEEQIDFETLQIGLLSYDGG